MNRLNSALASVSAVFLVLFAGCGGSPPVTEEMAMVPGLSFLHVHVSKSLDMTLLPEALGEVVPLWLCDSLAARGDFGISLLGVNLTDLSPQLLFLSANLDAGSMSDLGSEGFHCEARPTDGGYDLVDSRGSILGSVASRNGWSCLITGSGSDRAADRWLTMEQDQSLAADTDLVSIAQSDADLNILISRNSISFLSVIPTGMLDRQQITYLNLARRLIEDLGIRAARASLDVTDDDPEAISVEFRLVREDGFVTTISAGFSDTGIPPDSLAFLLGQMFSDGGR